MKKTVLQSLIAITVMVINSVSAQMWVPTAINPVSSPELVNVTGYASQGDMLYVTKTNTDGRTTVLAYEKTTSVVSTVPGGESLPITIDPTLGQSVAVSPDNTLYVVGAGVGSDSCIFSMNLTSGGSLTNVWGPKHRPSGRFAWITGVKFLGGDTYFCGRFDSVGSQKVPNLCRYSAGSFYPPAGAGLVDLNYRGNTNWAQPMLAAKNSNPGELMFTAPYRGDSVLVITGPTTARLEKLTVPADVDISASGVERNAISYKDDIYFGSWDVDFSGNDLSYRIVRKHSDGTVEVISKVYMQSMVQGKIFDWEVLNEKLIIVFQKGTSFRDTLSHVAMTEVMAYDSISFAPVVTTTSGFGTDGLTKINGNIVFGATVLDCDGIAGLGFYELNLVDTTPPVVILDGAATVTINKGGAWNDPGAAAVDNFDGEISSSIVVTTGSVNVGVVGTYVLTYTATDAAGNSGSTNRTVVVDDPSGISNDHDNQVRVVVSAGYVTVSGFENSTASIFNMEGRCVAQPTLRSETSISTETLIPGIYILKIENKTVKFFVQ